MLPRANLVTVAAQQITRQRSCHVGVLASVFSV